MGTGTTALFATDDAFGPSVDADDSDGDSSTQQAATRENNACLPGDAVRPFEPEKEIDMSTSNAIPAESCDSSAASVVSVRRTKRIRSQRRELHSAPGTDAGAGRRINASMARAGRPSVLSIRADDDLGMGGGGVPTSPRGSPRHKQLRSTAPASPTSPVESAGLRTVTTQSSLGNYRRPSTLGGASSITVNPLCAAPDDAGLGIKRLRNSNRPVPLSPMPSPNKGSLSPRPPAQKEPDASTAAEITQAEYNNFHRMFRAYDADGSGTIDADELGNMMQGLGVPMSDDDLRALFQEALGEDEELLEIEFPEFVELMAKHKEKLMKDGEHTDETARYIAETMRSVFFLVDSPTRWFLDGFMFMAVAYYCFAVTLQYASQLSRYEGFTVIEALLHFVFAGDIFLQFGTIPQVTVIEVDAHDMKQKDIVHHYLRNGFLADLVSSLPIEFFITNNTWKNGLRSLKLLKVFRIPSFFSSSGGLRLLTPAYISFLYSVVPLIQLAFWLAASVHWFAVVWLLLAPDKDDVLVTVGANNTLSPASVTASAARPFSEEYLDAIYIVLYTVTTVGYGDIEVTTVLQKTFACGLFVAGAVINGFVVSKMNKVLSRSDITSERKAKMVEMVNILRFFRIPASIQYEILSFQHHILDHNLSSAYSEIIDALPTNMQDQLSLYVKLKLVSKVPLFNAVHDECKVAIAQSLCNTVVQPHEFIICAGEIGKEMYFLGHGVAEVLQPTGQHLATIRKGMFFGEMALVFGMAFFRFEHPSGNTRSRT
ncbi:Potassium channel SKOR [Diplonema papillatum]|nr:Potassium channel SKOR [Diplonema papillatum]